MISSVKLKPLTWHPHIAPVELSDATPEQFEAMKVTPSAKKVSEYVRTLVHDPESYVARTVLFNAIMYVEGGLPALIANSGPLAHRWSTAAPFAPLRMLAGTPN